MPRRKQRVRVGATERRHRTESRGGWKKADKCAKRKRQKNPASCTVYANRNRLLRDMGYPSYHAYLASDLWESIRGRVLEDWPICQLCPGNAATQVHHQSYDRDTLAGRAMHNLYAVCARCHRRIEFDKHGHKRSGSEVFAIAAKRMYRCDGETRPAWRLEAESLDADLAERLAATTT